jgi:hypothetical protein
MKALCGCWPVALLAGLVGCAPGRPRPVDTGAREVVRGYCEALLRQDWQQAYATLHPDTQKRLGSQDFTRLARAYRRSFGFDPVGTSVQSVDEEGEQAVAHVAFVGSKRRYKDGVLLRRSAGNWRVFLLPTFGQKLK